MPKLPVALRPEELRRVCNPNRFDFETIASLPNVQEVLGQPRAVAALEFGVGMASHGFSLFALGLPGSGKTTLIPASNRRYLMLRTDIVDAVRSGQFHIWTVETVGEGLAL